MGSIKAWLYGTFHNFSVKDLALYVNEFTHRLNEGNVKINRLDRIISENGILANFGSTGGKSLRAFYY